MERFESKKENNTTLVTFQLTVDEWNNFSSTEKADYFREVISVERAKKVLIDLIKTGAVVINDSKTFARWTSRRIVVKGDDLSAVQGYNKPTETLTKEEFEALSPEEMAGYIQKYVSYDRAKTGVIILIGKGLPVPPETAMRWSNGRFEFAGLEKQRSTTGTGVGRGHRRRVDPNELVTGLTLNGQGASDAVLPEVFEEVEAKAIQEEEESLAHALVRAEEESQNGSPRTEDVPDESVLVDIAA